MCKLDLIKLLSLLNCSIRQVKKEVCVNEISPASHTSMEYIYFVWCCAKLGDEVLSLTCPVLWELVALFLPCPVLWELVADGETNLGSREEWGMLGVQEKMLLHCSAGSVPSRVT